METRFQREKGGSWENRKWSEAQGQAVPVVEVETVNGLLGESASRCYNRVCAVITSQREKI